jgi:hypothetical protein
MKSLAVGGIEVLDPRDSSTFGGSVGRRVNRERVGSCGCLKTYYSMINRRIIPVAVNCLLYARYREVWIDLWCLAGPMWRVGIARWRFARTSILIWTACSKNVFRSRTNEETSFTPLSVSNQSSMTMTNISRSLPKLQAIRSYPPFVLAFSVPVFQPKIWTNTESPRGCPSEVLLKSGEDSARHIQAFSISQEVPRLICSRGPRICRTDSNPSLARPHQKAKSFAHE